jgi:hypothetical protein
LARSLYLLNLCIAHMFLIKVTGQYRRHHPLDNKIL